MMTKQLQLFIESSEDVDSSAEHTPHKKCKRAPTMQLRRKAMNRKERLVIRDRMIVARLYYWREIKRMRLDDVLIILSDDEFCIEERTINNAWAKQAGYFEELCRNRTTARQLKKIYPSFSF